MNSKKIFGLALAFAVFATSGLWAQTMPGVPAAPAATASMNLPNSIWSSPQSDATQGRYRSAADDFIRPDTYTSVKFDKWYGFTSFTPKSAGGNAAIGYATKAGDLYIGAFYTGNLWAGLKSNFNYHEESITNLFDSTGSNKTYKIYDDYGANNQNLPRFNTAPLNNVAVLIGVADMGFRLTYRTDHQSFAKTNNIVSSTAADFNDPDNLTYYKDLEYDAGYHAPQIAWAMAKDLTDFGIRPYATVDLIIYRNYVARTDKLIDNTVSTDWTDGTIASLSAGDSIGTFIASSNRTTPMIAMGLGGFTFYNEAGFKLTADFDYGIAFDLYDNEYSYYDAADNKLKSGSIQGLYTPSANRGFLDDTNGYESSNPTNMRTLTEARHNIQFSLAGSYSKDNFAFKFKFIPEMRINGGETTQMFINGEGKLVKQGNDTKFTTFQFQPDLRLALQWKIFDGKLALNASERLRTSTISSTTTEGSRYNNDNEVADSSFKTVTESFGAETDYLNQFRLGVTFIPTNYFSIEAVVGNDVDGTMTNNRISVFQTNNTNGLLNFGAILVGLKF